MKDDAKRERLSEILDRIFLSKREESTIGELVDELDHHGLAMILILFSVVSALPIPAAGYSTLLSIPLLCIAMHLLIGKEQLWLPKKLKNKSFTPQSLEKAHRLIRKGVIFIEQFSKPRLVLLVGARFMQLLLGVLVLCLAAFMALPIPGTNTLPAGGIFLIGFGLLEDDGLLVLLGIVYSVLALIVACVILYLGYEGYEMIKDWIKSFL